MEDHDPSVSVALYKYMCDKIVGTEEDVKRLRLFNAMIDKTLYKARNVTYITSGSIGEGLLMKGSDMDLMSVRENFHVYENVNLCCNGIFKNIFIMDQEDTKPGFTRLRLLHNISKYSEFYTSYCITEKGTDYLSSTKMKNNILRIMCVGLRKPFCEIHGPCISDINGRFDFAHCIHSKLWISQARPWITRSYNKWPSDELKQIIVDHGVLFVPIGMKNSPTEDIEWRISFSVGEKILIYTFSHVQIVCYALMKILLKDVIAKQNGCAGLLCSYFLKTVIFWLSEELSPSVWKPENLIYCFGQCLRRLIYYINLTVCPHYFIPENNLFESKIGQQERAILLENIDILNIGWRSVFYSSQLSDFLSLQPNNVISVSKVKFIHCNFLVSLITTVPFMTHENVENIILSCKSSRIKRVALRIRSSLYTKFSQTIPVEHIDSNKRGYENYRTCLCYLLQTLNKDAVSGWLLIASLFYNKKQYWKCLYILSYCLSKCTPEMLYPNSPLSELQRQLLICKILEKMDSFAIIRLVYANYLTFSSDSQLIPRELECKFETFQPLVYTYVLSFLCHYRLGNVHEYQSALRNLKLNIDYTFSFDRRDEICSSLCCLIKASEMVGDLDQAKEAARIGLQILEMDDID